MCFHPWDKFRNSEIESNAHNIYPRQNFEVCRREDDRGSLLVLSLPMRGRNYSYKLYLGVVLCTPPSTRVMR